MNRDELCRALDKPFTALPVIPPDLRPLEAALGPGPEYKARV